MTLFTSGPVTSVPSSDLILSRLFLQISCSWNYTHSHTRNSPLTHAHMELAQLSSSLTPPETLCPLPVWWSLSLSVSDTLTLLNWAFKSIQCYFTQWQHVFRRFTCTTAHLTTQTHKQTVETASFFPNSRTEPWLMTHLWRSGRTESSLQSDLQVKCAQLSHAAAGMTTLKCFLFPRKATRCSSSHFALCSWTFIW